MPNLKKTPKATEQERLKKILEIRLKYVIPQYQDDVRARKTAIIDGQGIVHNVMRNFNKRILHRETEQRKSSGSKQTKSSGRCARDKRDNHR